MKGGLMNIQDLQYKPTKEIKEALAVVQAEMDLIDGRLQEIHWTEKELSSQGIDPSVVMKGTPKKRHDLDATRQTLEIDEGLLMEALEGRRLASARAAKGEKAYVTDKYPEDYL